MSPVSTATTFEDVVTAVAHLPVGAVPSVLHITVSRDNLKHPDLRQILPNSSLPRLYYDHTRPCNLPTLRSHGSGDVSKLWTIASLGEMSKAEAGRGKMK